MTDTMDSFEKIAADALEYARVSRLMVQGATAKAFEDIADRLTALQAGAGDKVLTSKLNSETIAK